MSNTNSKINRTDIELFKYIDLNDINAAISEIDTNKSHSGHYHWKSLPTTNHYAKLCSVEVINYWMKSVLNNCLYSKWDFFLTNVTFLSKNGKKDLSSKSSYRPISIGTSEN